MDRYNFYGKGVGVESSDRQLLEKIRKSWKAFYRRRQSLRPEVLFHLSKYSGLPPVKNQYFSNSHFLFLLDSKTCMTCHFARRPWRVYLQYFKEPTNEEERDDLVFVAFGSLLRNSLKRLGLFQWHSAAVTKGGCGILIPAKRGGGKTTTSLGLIKENFKLVADDQVFLTQRGAVIYALGFERDLSLTEESLSFFPELKFLKKAPFVKKGRCLKKVFTLKRFKGLFSNRVAPQTKVSHVLFPRLSSHPGIQIKPISKSEALAQMLEQESRDCESLLIKDGVTLGKQLNLYSTLCETARAYNLYLGRKAGDATKKILEALEN